MTPCAGRVGQAGCCNNDGGLHLARRYEDAGEAGDDDFMQAELDKLDQMGLTDHGRVD